MNNKIKFILASSSPRRKALLSDLGLTFKTFSPEVDESPLAGVKEKPELLCKRLAGLKAQAYKSPDDLDMVIAADTIVVVDDLILGKPSDEEDNLYMLKQLQGRAHFVYTGLAIRFKGKVLSEAEKTEVRFRELSMEALRSYSASGEGLDKAGGYAIQGKGSLLVEAINGDYFNVVGLPICLMGKMMETFGLCLFGGF